MFENIDQLWNNFLNDAKIYESRREIYFSPSERGKYQIISTVKNVIRISRINKKESIETLGKVKFKRAINNILNFNPKIPKGEIYDHVATETTIVELLPMLDWSDDGKQIIETGAVENIANEILPSEALNDDINERRIISMRVRRGQNKFREKLFHAYNNKCSISLCTVTEVLHACHINPHSTSGINLSSNGLILRSDIHDLFDANLIAINPINNKISIHKSLNQTEYFQFNDIPLATRVDTIEPDKNALQERWNDFLKI